MNESNDDHHHGHDYADQDAVHERGDHAHTAMLMMLMMMMQWHVKITIVYTHVCVSDHMLWMTNSAIRNHMKSNSNGKRQFKLNSVRYTN